MTPPRAHSMQNGVSATNRVGFYMESCLDKDIAAPASPEEESLEHFGRAYATAKHQLQKAQEEFDARDKTRGADQVLNERMQRRSGGTAGFPQAEFDVRWVAHNMKLTRQLIERENAFRRAKAAALEGGYDLRDSDASSGFDNARNDGYPPAWEILRRIDAPVDDIEAWLQSVTAGLEPPPGRSEPSLDPWEGSEVRPEDSQSAKAAPRLKARIDRWQAEAASLGRSPLAYTTREEAREFARRDGWL